MKTLIIIFISLVVIIAKAQDQSPDRWVDDGETTKITLPQNGRLSVTKNAVSDLYIMENVAQWKMSDAPLDFLKILNATGVSETFIPMFLGHNQTDNRASMFMIGSTNYNNDYGVEPIVIFDARKYGDAEALTDGSEIANRALFRWQSYKTPYMTLSAKGALGIGTITPQAQLHTTGSVRFEGVQGGLGNALLTTDAQGTLLRNFLPNNSTVAIATTSPAINSLPRFNQSNVLVNSQLYDNGTNIGIGGVPVPNAKVTVYGTINALSDARTKRNIAPIANALQIVNQLNGYYYNWNTSDEKQVGLIAQEVENVLPELVSHSESGTKFLNYDGLTPVLVEAIKEQQQLLKLQAAQIKELQKEIEKLKKR